MADPTTDLTPTGLTPLGGDPGFQKVLDVTDPAAIGGALMNKNTTINLPNGPASVDLTTGGVTPGGTPMTSSGTPSLTDIKSTSASGATTDALTKLISDFETSNKATQDEILKNSAPSTQENTLQKQIDDLNAQMQKGLLNIEGRPIPLEDMGGEQLRLTKNTAAILQPLETALARASSTRQGILGRLTTALGFQQNSQDLQLKRAQLLAQPILDAEKDTRNYILDLAKKYPDAKIALDDTVQSAAEKVAGSKLYQNEVAASEATTDDIKEYKFAKKQGYTGTLLQFMDRKSGGGAGGDVGPVNFTTPTPEAPKQTFEQFLAAAEQKAGQTFGEKKRADLRKEFDAQQAKTASPDIKALRETWLNNPNVAPIVKSLIRGNQGLDKLSDTEQKKYGSQIEQAQAAGVMPTQSTAKQLEDFNKLSTERSKSPLILASDKMGNYLGIIQNAATGTPTPQKDLALIYAYIKALDFGDSAVREGEISLGINVGSVKQKLEAAAAKLGGTGLMGASQRNNYVEAAKSLIDTINSAAKKKDEQFAAKAKGLGISDQWTDYTGASTSNASVGTAGKTSSGMGYKIIP